jgi:sulfite exporter TauE/SafE
LVQLQRAAAVIAGGIMVVWGVAMLLPLLGLRLPGVGLSAKLTELLQRLSARLGKRPPVVRALLLGAMTTLLPCGWLWAFVVAAAGAGSALGGGAVMVAFWLGTVPALLGLGLGVRQAARLFGRYLPAMTALAVIAIGLVQLTGRITMPHHHGHGHHAVPGLPAPAEHPPAHHEHEDHAAH